MRRQAISPQRSASSSCLSRLRLGAIGCAFAIVILSAIAAPAFANEFQLIRRTSLSVREGGGLMQTIRLASINDQFLEHVPADRSTQRVMLSECIALVNPAAATKPRTAGLVTLSDGQRVPGEAALGATPVPEHLAWSHPWLGRIDLPLKLIESAMFTAKAAAPPHGELDVVLLSNGDHQEGLISEIANNVVVLEVERGGAREMIQIPLRLVASISMLAAKSAPTAAKRVWFDDGTVLDVQSIVVGDDGYVRLSGSSLAGGTQATRVNLAQIAAILFDSRSMIPLAGLAPTRVEGPATRYVLPKPAVLQPDAPLGLSAVEYHGPLVARYALPPGAMRFAAEVELPPSARQWGDCELVIRSNDSEVFRTRLHAASPTAAVNIALTGRELTIEIVEGESGPIQDRIVLHRPMLLMQAGR